MYSRLINAAQVHNAVHSYNPKTAVPCTRPTHHAQPLDVSSPSHPLAPIRISCCCGNVGDPEIPIFKQAKAEYAKPTPRGGSKGLTPPVRICATTAPVLASSLVTLHPVWQTPVARFSGVISYKPVSGQVGVAAAAARQSRVRGRSVMRLALRHEKTLSRLSGRGSS